MKKITTVTLFDDDFRFYKMVNEALKEIQEINKNEVIDIKYQISMFKSMIVQSALIIYDDGV